MERGAVGCKPRGGEVVGFQPIQLGGERRAVQRDQTTIGIEFVYVLGGLLHPSQCVKEGEGRNRPWPIRKETLFTVLNFQCRKRNASVIAYREPCSQPSAEGKPEKIGRAHV